MKQLSFIFIDSIAKDKTTTIDDILKNERLTKYLWIEFILNPKLAYIAKSYLGNSVMNDILSDSVSWYLAFRWLFPENKALEELYKEKAIIPYKIKNYIYREKKRDFLKGILHARLC